MGIEAGDTVHLEYTGRREDGTVFDTTRKEVAKEAGILQEGASHQFEPLTVEVGEEQLLEGFESAIEGLEVNDTTSVTLEPEDAYGEWEEEKIREFDRDKVDRLTGNKPIEEGSYLETTAGTRQEVLYADDEIVRVDFNHYLAGDTITFDIEIVDIE